MRHHRRQSLWMRSSRAAHTEPVRSRVGGGAAASLVRLAWRDDPRHPGKMAGGPWRRLVRFLRLGPIAEPMLAPSDRVERATWLAAASAGLVLVHVLIDQHIGLWGPTSDSMSHLQAANLGARGVLFAWWMLVVVWIQDPGRKGAPLALFLLVFIEGFLSPRARCHRSLSASLLGSLPLPGSCPRRQPPGRRLGELGDLQSLARTSPAQRTLDGRGNRGHHRGFLPHLGVSGPTRNGAIDRAHSVANVASGLPHSIHG